MIEDTRKRLSIENFFLIIAVHLHTYSLYVYIMRTGYSSCSSNIHLYFVTSSITSTFIFSFYKLQIAHIDLLLYIHSSSSAAPTSLSFAPGLSPFGPLSPGFLSGPLWPCFKCLRHFFLGPVGLTVGLSVTGLGVGCPLGASVVAACSSTLSVGASVDFAYSVTTI